MEDAERAALSDAVKALNAQLVAIGEKYGDRIQIRPHVNYSTGENFAEIVVQVTTGVETFR